MNPKYEPSGISASDHNVTVYFTESGPGYMRFRHVRFPLEWLLDASITAAMDRQVRRTLIEAWSEVDLCDPLF